MDKGTPAGAEGGNRMLLRFAALDADQDFSPESLPRHSAVALTGLSVKMPPASRGAGSLAAFGYGELTGEAHFDGTYDAQAKTYRLDRYELSVKDAGRIALSGQLSGLEAKALSGTKAEREAASRAATIDWAQIEVGNAGLFEKFVALSALSQRQTPDAIKAQWRALVMQAPVLLSGAPAVASAAQAVDRFIGDPKTLVLRVKTNGAPLTVGGLSQIDDPLGLLSKLDVSSPPPGGGKN